MTTSMYPDLPALLAANARSDRHIRLVSSADSAVSISFADLADTAQRVAANLAARGIEPGHELVLHTRSNKTFLEVFWGAVLAGVVPVPIAVGKTDEQRQKLNRVLTQLRHPALLDDDETTPIPGVSPERRFSMDALHSTLAFIQYSSGSTGDPKGVCVTHGNITSNCDAIVAGLGWSDADRGLSWMPLTHDMGLIVMHLSQLSVGMSHTVIDTDLFIRRPQFWLEEASREKSTVLCSPNFGYRHFLKLYDRKPSEHLALDAVTTIFNGAEPISRPLCDEFLGKMAAHGLRRETMLPVYGLAEGTVGVTLPPLDDPFNSVFVDRYRLSIGQRTRPLGEGDPAALELMKVGSPIRHVELRIVDNDDRELPAEHTGHIQIRGLSVTAGYYGLAEQSRQVRTVDGWLRTGDCGFIDHGQLVISGRQKDIIIVNGQNFYAHDLERFAFDVGSLELGKVAVAAARRPGDTLEQVVVFVIYRGDNTEFDALARPVAEAIAGGTGVQVDYVVPVPRIPKTTSGKVQRSVLGENFASGEYSKTAFAAGSPAESSAPVPTNTLEKILAICAEHAGAVRIGADDDLFDVGISSLTLTEISLGIDEYYPGKVSIDDLFECPTPRQIAERLDASADD